MRSGLTLSGIAAIGVLAAGFIAAAPAHANSNSNSLFLDGGENYQYLVTCDSAATCNTVSSRSLDIQFVRAQSDPRPLGVFYQVTNGTAINGTDFNTPVTGEAIIPANGFTAALTIPLVNEHEFGTSKTFTVTITSTTYPITISRGSAQGDIFGGNIPLDCSFTYVSGTTQSMTCTQRPATQTWALGESCKTGMVGFIEEDGNQVTGNGTSTLNNCNSAGIGTLNIIS